MTKKLEELFGFPPSEEESPDLTVEDTRAQLAEIDATIDKIDAALPTVRDLETGDNELDEIATMAKDSYNNLMDLGMQVEGRFASEVFAVAGTMLGHALTAKTAKLNKKLKMIDLQLKKLKLDQDQATKSGNEPVETAHGQVLSRNDLLQRLLSTKDQNSNKA
jgi:hypothetical protein